MDSTDFNNAGAVMTENLPTPSRGRQSSDAGSPTSMSSTLTYNGEGSRHGSSAEMSYTTLNTEQADDKNTLAKKNSASTPVTESMPWYREALFVGTICLSQLFTRKCSELTTHPYLVSKTKKIFRSRRGPGSIDRTCHRCNMGP